MAQQLEPLRFGGAAAILAAACMLLLGILANVGIYTGAAAMMQQWHMFFSLSLAGILAGMIEAAVLSFVCVGAFALIYNRLLKQ